MLKSEQISYKISQKYLIQDISLELQAGEFTVVLGPNGAGKSTLLKLLAGSEKPSDGQIWYDETLIQKIPIAQLSKQKAVLSQMLALPFDLKVQEVVMMGRYPYFNVNPTKIDEQICDECLQKVGMNDFRERDFASLSGGEKQKVHLARVLAQLHRSENDFSAKYLFLDEPISALDVHFQHQILSYVKQLSHENTVIFVVLHDINLALKYAQKVILMHKGKIHSIGTPQEVMTEKNILDVFDIKVSLLQHPKEAFKVVVF